MEVLELEEIAGLGKDPSSRSRPICGGKGRLGPNNSNLPIFVHGYKVVVLILHMVLLLFLASLHTFDAIIYTNFGIGLIAYILICYV